RVRLRAGNRLSSTALIADGNHARIDGFVSLGVIVGALVVAVGAPRADPLIGLLITLVFLMITWDSWRTVRASEPGMTRTRPWASPMADVETAVETVDPPPARTLRGLFWYFL